MKKSFVLYSDNLDVLDELNDEQAGKLFKAIKEYQISEKEILEGMLKVVFIPFRNQLKRDKDKYLLICERNRLNGQKGGRPKETQGNPKNPGGLSGNPKKPKKAYTDNKNENKYIAKPENLEMVNSYFEEKGYPLTEAESFWDYYEANGWKVGRNPMKKWKSAVGNWMKDKPWKKKTHYSDEEISSFSEKQMIDFLKKDDQWKKPEVRERCQKLNPDVYDIAFIFSGQF